MEEGEEDVEPVNKNNLPDGKEIRKWLKDRGEQDLSSRTVAFCLRLARRMGHPSLSRVPDDDFELFVGTKTGSRAIVIPGYASRLGASDGNNHDMEGETGASRDPALGVNIQAKVVDLVKYHASFMVTLSSVMWDMATTIPSDAPRGAYECLWKNQRLGFFMLLGKFDKAPDEIRGILETSCSRYPLGIGYNLRNMKSELYKDLVEVYGTKMYQKDLKNDLRENIGTRLRDSVILGHVQSGTLARSRVWGWTKKRRVDGMSFHDFLKSHPELAYLPFQMTHGITQECALDLILSVGRKDTGTVDEDERDDTEYTTLLILWIHATRWLNAQVYRRTEAELFDESKSWRMWTKKNKFDPDSKFVKNFVEFGQNALRWRMLPDRKLKRNFINLGITQLLHLCGSSMAKFKSYNSVEERGRFVEGKLRLLRYSKAKVSRNLPLRRIAYLLKTHWQYAISRINYPDKDGLESLVEFPDDQDVIGDLEQLLGRIWGDRVDWERRLKMVLPEGTMLREDGLRGRQDDSWYLTGITTDGHSMHTIYKRKMMEKENLKEKFQGKVKGKRKKGQVGRNEKRTRRDDDDDGTEAEGESTTKSSAKRKKGPELEMVNDLPSSVNLENCKHPSLKQFIAGKSKIECRSVDPGSTFPYTAATHELDTRDPTRIPIRDILQRVGDIQSGGNILKCSGKDRSVFMGRLRDKKAEERIREDDSTYTSYIELAGKCPNPVSKDEILARHDIRRGHEEHILGCLGKKLTKRRAERFKKTQSAIRRDASKIMAPASQDTDGILVFFESGKFHPNKEHPYPLEKLKGLLKRCASKERVPAFYQLVPAHKTSCLCIGCGEKYSCPHEIRVCRHGECILENVELVRDDYSGGVTISTVGDLTLGGYRLSKFE